MKVIDLSYLDYRRDIIDKTDSGLKDSYEYYKPRQKTLSKQELEILKLIEKEIEKRRK